MGLLLTYEGGVCDSSHCTMSGETVAPCPQSSADWIPAKIGKSPLEWVQASSEYEQGIINNTVNEASIRLVRSTQTWTESTKKMAAIHSVLHQHPILMLKVIFNSVTCEFSFLHNALLLLCNVRDLFSLTPRYVETAYRMAVSCCCHKLHSIVEIEGCHHCV